MPRTDAYRRKLNAQIGEWSARLEQLQAKGKTLQADAKIEFDKRMNELRTKLTMMRHSLKEIEGAGADAWRSVKQRLENLKTEFSQALERTERHDRPVETARR